MSSLNKVMLIGNVGKILSDVNDSFFKFSLATSEKWKDKNSGQNQEKTEWHNIICFGKLTDTGKKYITVGMKIYIDGKLSTNMYEKDGENRYSTSIICNDFKFLSTKNNQDEHTHKTEGFTDQTEGFTDDDIPF